MVDDVKSQKLFNTQQENNRQEREDEKKHNGDINNNKENGISRSITPAVSETDNHSDEEQNIIPWRAQLRKTNSKLNLLEWFIVFLYIYFNYNNVLVLSTFGCI